MMFQQPAVSSLAANKADFSLAWEMLWFNNRIRRKYEDGQRNMQGLGDGLRNYEDGSWNYGDGLQNLQGIIEAGKTVC